MSLLDRGRETITIFHEREYTSPDGNVMTGPSTTDVEILDNCVIQIGAQSGTSARRAEQDQEGFETEIVYRLRPPRWYTRQIGAQAEVEWNGLRYNVIGDVHTFNGSDNTRHQDYTLRRT